MDAVQIVKQAVDHVTQVMVKNKWQPKEADQELFLASKNLILSMEKLHPGKLMLFSWWPENGKDNVVPYVHGKTQICNFCANFVIPSDDENYGEFLNVLKQFKERKLAAIDNVFNAIENCNGHYLFWS